MRVDPEAMEGFRMRGLERRIPWRVARLSLLSLVALLGMAAPAFAATFHVQVGGGVPGVPAGDLQAFYPQRTWVNVGDSVQFDINSPHTVTFPVKGQPEPALAQPLSPLTMYPPQMDAANQPFWFGGKVPELGFNPLVFLPSGGNTYDGSQVTGSGFTPPPAVPPPFTLTFTKVGAFKYACGLHPNMRGSIHVRAKGNPVPSAASQAMLGHEQMESDIEAAQARAHTVSELQGGRTVLAGSGARDYSLLGFYPSSVTVHVGQPVTFKMGGREEVHTVTFGPDPGPMNGPPPDLLLNPLAVLSSDPGSPPGPLAISPTIHGNGFASSGFLFDPTTVPNRPRSWTVTFTQIGNYSYFCQIHDFMTGTVTVKA
jgi:plastocyanin